MPSHILSCLYSVSLRTNLLSLPSSVITPLHECDYLLLHVSSKTPGPAATQAQSAARCCCLLRRAKAPVRAVTALQRPEAAREELPAGALTQQAHQQGRAWPIRSQGSVAAPGADAGGASTSSASSAAAAAAAACVDIIIIIRSNSSSSMRRHHHHHHHHPQQQQQHASSSSSASSPPSSSPSSSAAACAVITIIRSSSSSKHTTTITVTSAAPSSPLGEA